ncbi:hypothetical protein [Micromonospora sp. HM5-17]|jgi:hypothetical protein|uniref:LppU/SCO3897 family protein n=1 Tax=Micromonospora sp. HM5-17 TaxID=2487710 RepID=UPI000F4995B7|nr:hypothetical protein [Micromonospora sp. HM5-17]ROT33600.1 hypothetical protein EF879_01215 [Micromonospora sp. HM5-17]
MSTDQTASPADAPRTDTTPGAADDPPTDEPTKKPTGAEAGVTQAAAPADEPAPEPADQPPADGPEPESTELPPAGEPAQPPKKKRVFWTVAGVLGAVLVVMVLIGGGKDLLGSFLSDLAKGTDHIDKVVVGDCLKETPRDGTSPYRIVGCDDAAATYKTLAVVKGGTRGSCINVAGANRSITNSTGTVCMGPKDVDPARAVNVAKEGDCLGVVGDDAQRVDCSDTDARYVVLARLSDVLKSDVERACATVPATVSTYAWDWGADPSGNPAAGRVDVVLCLGEK